MWRLLEPRRRRISFLEEVVRELALDNCEVVGTTAEEAGRDPRLARAHALAAARALAPPRRALALLLPLVATGGAAAVFIGGGDDVPPEAEEFAPGIGILRPPA
jgi:16S rRNA (guanine527-N7)-methyltransferase